MPDITYDVYTLDTEEYAGQFTFEHTSWLMATASEVQAQFEDWCTLNGLDADDLAYERAL